MSLVCGVVRESLLVGSSTDWRVPTAAGRLSLGCTSPGEHIAVLRLDERHTTAREHWPWRPVDDGFLLIAQAHASWVDIKTHLRMLGRMQQHGSAMFWPWFSAAHMHVALLHLQPDEVQPWFGPFQAFVFSKGDEAVWVHQQGMQVKVQELVWHPVV
ncbi:MAG TPA: hypothetical protein VFV39_08820 [Limnobacter sp.]|nr:hypothetical protein [Limnobacter sp.]